MDEGYIKYTCTWLEADCGIPHAILAELNQARSVLREHGLIGVLTDGVGYGNISIRKEGTDEFWISGSATGGINELSPGNIARVIGINIQRNHLTCQGGTMASSESMSHGAVYAVNPGVMAVIHVHHRGIWEHRDIIPSHVSADAAYGTVEMAMALRSLAREAQVPHILRMEGHEHGILAFACSMASALETVLKTQKQLS